MKFGCITKFISIIIVILGTSFYVYEKYAKDYIIESSEKVKEIAIDKIESMIENLDEKEVKNTINQEFTEILNDIKKRKSDFSEKQFEEITDSLSKILKNEKYDQKSLENLKKLIEKKK
jgi:hypothetical protein